MSELRQIHETVKRIEASNKKIEVALFGDTTMGVPGIVKRMGAVEGKQKTYALKQVYWAGFVAGVSAVFGLISWYLSHKP